MINVKQVIPLPPGVFVDIYHTDDGYVARLEFSGTGADQYEAQHNSAMAIGDLIALLKERYENALENANTALAKESWDQ